MESVLTPDSMHRYCNAMFAGAVSPSNKSKQDPRMRIQYTSGIFQAKYLVQSKQHFKWHGMYHKHADKSIRQWVI